MLGVRRKFVGAGLYVLSTAGVLAGGGCSGDAGKDDADRDGATGGTSSDDDRAPSGGMGGDDNGWDGSDLSLGGSGGSGTGGAGTGGSGTGGGKDDGCSVVAAAVKTHVDAMATSGWAHLNAQAELAMYGCVGSEATRNCLSEKTDAASTVYGADWTDDSPGTTIRVLRTNTAASSYWTRSSPDGRFVAYGLASGTANGNAEVFDLERDAAVPVMALYDPAFFPDGSGWVLQGGDRNTCSRSVLTSEPSALTTLETGCAKISEIGLNQSLGAEPSGDYLALDGSFRGDNGGRVATLANPFADFGPAAGLQLTSLVFNGTGFQADDTASLTLPDEGNFALSPSGSLVLSRLGSPNDIEQHGYRLRSLAWNEAHTALETTELGHYCINGGDAAFSFDERWIVLHHYVEASDAEELGFTGEDDPAFAEYLSKGASNLYLIETATGLRQRITRMAPGQYALFPHFRSDGWLYFVVRTAGTTTEYIAASDAAL